MSQIPFYKNIVERNRMFSRIEITNFNNLIDVLKEDESKGGFFRGQADSSWKLYSNLHREYILKDLVLQFESPMKLFQELINLARIRKSEELKQCQDQYDLAVGSVLQHYGCPTPFLDFSDSFDVALFFATESMSINGFYETNKYFSIYVLFEGGTPKTPGHDFMNYSRIFNDFMSKMGSNEMKAFRKKFPNGQVPQIDELKYLSFFSTFQLLLLKDTDKEWLKIKNTRLCSQKGLFVFSGTNGILPYEEIMQPLPDNVNKYDKLIFDQIKVYDIHKSTANEVKHYLEQKQINRTSLGFKEYSWGRALFDQLIS